MPCTLAIIDYYLMLYRERSMKYVSHCSNVYNWPRLHASKVLAQIRHLITLPCDDSTRCKVIGDPITRLVNTLVHTCFGGEW